MLLEEGLEHVRIIHVHLDDFAVALSRDVSHKTTSRECHAIFIERNHIFILIHSLVLISFSIVVSGSLCFYLLGVLQPSSSYLTLP